MKIVITGALGFIGINLCKNLLSKGYEVLGIDNFYCSNRFHLKELEQHNNFSFLEHDIINPIPISNNFVPDLLCNLACPASPVQYLKDSIYTTKTNVFGMINMLDLAIKYDVPILQASTSEVYGDPLEHPQTESYWGHVNSIGIRACYDEGKRLAESLCFDYKRQHKAKIKISRIFNTYGPYMASDDGRVVSNFIVQALHKKPLTVYGKGQQTRSFCFIDDLVEGIVRFLLLDDPHNEVTGPINLGNNDEITIQELAYQINKYIPHTSIEYKILPEDDPQQRKPDSTQAKKILAWEPKITLAEGLPPTIAWLKTYNL